METLTRFEGGLVRRLFTSGFGVVFVIPLVLPAMGADSRTKQMDLYGKTAESTPAAPKVEELDERGKDPELRCIVPASDACRAQCAEIGAYCAHRSAHPYKSDGGTGDLYWCKGGWPSYTCSYQYSNGDNCTIIYPIGTSLCRYPGGKVETSK